jgi:3-oxoacyl-[acyl-carrier protein] reductase
MDSPLALVTGSSRGIGRAVAIRLARDGYRIVVNYRSNQEAAEAVGRLIQSEGGQVIVSKFDVANQEETEQAVKGLVRSEGPIHTLVNNAGISQDYILMEMPSDAWHHVINTDLNGVYYCTKTVLRTMAGKRRPDRRIVNISSIVGEKGGIGLTNYAAAKAGIIGFTKALAREVAPLGITVNAVAPGYIDTDLMKHLPPQTLYDLLKSIPLGRIGLPEEVASVVSFLASPNAGYITGQVIRVDGGYWM